MKKFLENMPLLSYLLLAVCAVLAVAFAADAYSGIAGRAETGSDIRTAGQFMAMKTRQAANGSDICCEGESTAVFLERGEYETFQDCVYGHAGWLMELYTDEESRLYYGADEESGDRLITCGDASFQYSGGLLEYGLDIGGHRVSGAAYARGGTE